MDGRDKDIAMTWVEQYFTDLYLKKYRPRQTTEQNLKEARFIADAMNLMPPDRILDVCCGYGRHMKPLHDMGFDVYGLDQCQLFLDEAKVLLGDDKRLFHDRIDKVKFPILTFNAAYNFFTSFGYSTDTENEQIISNIRNHLDAKGKFLLHTRNREWLLQHFVGNQWDTFEDTIELTKRKFNLRTGCMEAEITYLPGWRKIEQTVRFYTLTEITALLSKNAFTITDAWGGIDFTPYTKDSEWMIVIAEKQ